MKYFYTLLFSMVVIYPLQGMQEQRQSCCSTLSRLVYKATAWCGRNDYLYLTHANSLWYLGMKLQHKEQIGDINRYYLRYGATFNTRSAPIYVSPLHEAVQRGSLNAVTMLCEAGADKTLTIRPSIKEEEAAEGWHTGCPWMASSCPNEKVKQKIAAWYRSRNVGLSALQLAQKLSEESKYSDKQERESIYQFLKERK